MVLLFVKKLFTLSPPLPLLVSPPTTICTDTQAIGEDTNYGDGNHTEISPLICGQGS